jgi:DNA-directed RNA polymerase subunit N (RpoN/RPB10)
MIYLKCPTCSTILGNRQIIYETGLKEILNNKNLTDKMKEDEKLKLLNSLDLTNYCCKMRVITYVNLTEILV